jgi:hypothetical protein
VDALARVLKSANIPLEREVPINGKERPADILAHRLQGSPPLAIDVTIVHPIATSCDHLQNRVSSAELYKHRHYDKLCHDAGLAFNACGFSTFGGAAPDAQIVMRKIKQRIAEIHGKAEGDTLGDQATERIIVSVMRGVAAQLIEGTPSADPVTPTDMVAPITEVSSGDGVMGFHESMQPQTASIAQCVAAQCPQYASIITERLLARDPGDLSRLQCSLPDLTSAINDELERLMILQGTHPGNVMPPHTRITGITQEADDIQSGNTGPLTTATLQQEDVPMPDSSLSPVRRPLLLTISDGVVRDLVVSPPR